MQCLRSKADTNQGYRKSRDGDKAYAISWRMYLLPDKQW